MTTPSFNFFRARREACVEPVTPEPEHARESSPDTDRGLLSDRRNCVCGGRLDTTRFTEFLSVGFCEVEVEVGNGESHFTRRGVNA